MKSIFFFLALFSVLGLAEEKKRQEPINILAPKNLATFDPNSGEWNLEKGVKPEEVMSTLLREVSNISAKYAELEKSCAAKKKPTNPKTQPAS